LVLGATGGTGQQVLAQAIDAGYDVTALVRSPGKISRQHPQLRILEGELSPGDLAHAVRDQDAVVSALGRGKTFKSEHLIERTVPVILAAMQDAGVRRLMFTSAFGVGPTLAQSPLLPKIFFRTLLRDIYADKAIGDDLIRRSHLDWTIVQPVMLNDGPLTRRYRSGERLALSGMPVISRANTAHFLLDRINDASTIGKTIVIAD
jgi:putative NADH-flavin reductase